MPPPPPLQRPRPAALPVRLRAARTDARSASQRPGRAASAFVEQGGPGGFAAVPSRPPPAAPAARLTRQPRPPPCPAARTVVCRAQQQNLAAKAAAAGVSIPALLAAHPALALVSAGWRGAGASGSGAAAAAGSPELGQRSPESAHSSRGKIAAAAVARCAASRGGRTTQPQRPSQHASLQQAQHCTRLCRRGRWPRLMRALTPAVGALPPLPRWTTALRVRAPARSWASTTPPSSG